MGMFNTRLSVAFVNAGRGKEYFEKYILGGVAQLKEGSVGEDNETIPLAGSTYVLSRLPDLLPQCTH